MKRRIHMSFIMLVLPSVLLLTSLLSLFFYNNLAAREIAAVKDSANLIADFLNRGLTADMQDYISGGPEALRITVIAPDGQVLLDNIADADALENHGARPEVIQAMQNGAGEARRYSDTLKAETYYYALCLRDGSVLRISKTLGSIAGVFAASLPSVIIVTLLILLLAELTTRSLTKRIVQPLESIDFAAENVPIYDELLPYAKKIDRQKQEIEQQISALKGRADTIEAIVGNLKEGLILLDKHGMVLTANNSVKDIFGETEQKNIVHVCRDLEFQQQVKECLNGSNGELSLTREARVYRLFLSPVLSGGEISGAVILFLNVTEEQQAEKQRREFSANVSHELKTPLTTISALSEMIESGMAKDQDVKAFAAKITEQAGRLFNIIEDIIRLSEFDEGGVQKEYTPFDLHELAKSVIAALQDSSNDKDIKINLVGKHFDITANRRMMDELMYNLIDNGVKYNKQGGQVNVELSRGEGFYKIAVSDTGIGISEKHLEHIFERFYRVDKSRSKKTGGTGLGLSIVKHIAEHHGGKVELKSVEGVGTTVTVVIRNS